MAKFRTATELVSFLQQEGHAVDVATATATMKIGPKVAITFDLEKNRFAVKGIGKGRDTIFNLTKPENHSVVMLLVKLLQKGYAVSTITLEKGWQTGHSPVYLDLMLKDPRTEKIFMIEVKEFDEFQKFTDVENHKKIKQLCSYAMQEQSTTIASFYTYDFEGKRDHFANIYCKELRADSLNYEDFFDRWNKVFDTDDYISNNPVFDIKREIKTFANLKNIDEKDTKSLFFQFLTILRLNSISDKPTAFMKMINLFLSKLADETAEDDSFTIKDTDGNLIHLHGTKFQYVENEAPESFMKRMNALYKQGMKEFLKKDVVDYSDEEVEKLINIRSNDSLTKVLDDLRLKKNNDFGFIEIYDDITFRENFEVVKAVVQILENFKLKYETKHQFLGDFFEELLTTSLKQEAGQFFTPYPMVDYMVGSLDFEQRIALNIRNKESDFMPTVIDYACGAGHFLISAMAAIQNILFGLSENGLITTQRKNLRIYKEKPYLWADEKKIVGIEKDYRLAKTTKIATFLNGDGDGAIIAGDGINKFDCREYQQTILYSRKKKLESFDYVISNPPYSVDGFMLNFRKNGIDRDSGDFSLLTGEINAKDSAIEIFFVERMEQLLKPGGIGAIILPQSVLSQEKYERMRRFLFGNFRILSMLLTADITFSGTTTSPVVLFLRKERVPDRNYKILVHQSPKYITPNASRLKSQEIQFLGYKFSENRSKSGITVVENSVLSDLAPLTKEFITTDAVDIPAEYSPYSKLITLRDILINVEDDYCGDIYPKRVISDGMPLSAYCKINSRETNDFPGCEEPADYLEIGDMAIQIPTKVKRSKRYCRKGDILVSSLTPRKNQIVIAQGDFMLTNAIHVLSSFDDDNVRDSVFYALRTEGVLKQMNALLDGFKITYAKISEKNLYNNVLISVEY